MVNAGNLSAKMTLDSTQFTREFSKVQSKTNKATSNIEKSFGRIQKLLAGGLIATGIKKLFDFGKAGDEINDITKAFESLSKAAGIDAAGALEKLRKATQGTVSDLDLLTTANLALSVGIIASEEALVSLAEAAKVLGEAVGVDATQAFDLLVNAIDRQSSKQLKSLGILVNTSDAYDAYAASIGRTTAALTDSQKQQAFAAATLDAAKKKTADLGGSQKDAGDAFERTTKAVDNFTDRLKAAISENKTFTGALEQVTKALDSLTKQDIKSLISSLLEVGKSFTGLGLVKFISDLALFGAATALVAKQFAGISLGAVVVRAQFSALIPILLSSKTAVGSAASSFVTFISNLTKSGSTLRTLLSPLKSLDNALIGVIARATAVETLGSAFKGLTALVGLFVVKILRIPFGLLTGAFSLLLKLITKLVIPLAVGAAAFGAMEGVVRPLINTINRLAGTNIGLVSALESVAKGLNFIANLASGTVSLALVTLAKGIQIVIDLLAKFISFIGGTALANALKRLSSGIDVFVEEANLSAFRAFEELGGTASKGLEEGLDKGLSKGDLGQKIVDKLIPTKQQEQQVKIALENLFRTQTQLFSGKGGGSSATNPAFQTIVNQVGHVVKGVLIQSEFASERLIQLNRTTLQQVAEDAKLITANLLRENKTFTEQAQQSNATKSGPTFSSGAAQINAQLVETANLFDKVSSRDPFRAGIDSITLYKSALDGIRGSLQVFDFDKTTRESSSVLLSLARSASVLGKNSAETREKIRLLEIALLNGGTAANKAREDLVQLTNELRVELGIAPLTAQAIEGFGVSAENAGIGLGKLQDELNSTQEALRQTAQEADGAAEAIDGISAAGGGGGGSSNQGFSASLGRTNRSLGSIVQGDVNNPQSIQRALTNLEQGRLSVASGFGDAGLGFKSIQLASLDRQIAILKENLAFAQEQTTQSIIAAIIDANRSFTGVEFQNRIREQIAISQRAGLIPNNATVNAVANFGRTQPV